VRQLAGEAGLTALTEILLEHYVTGAL